MEEDKIIFDDSSKIVRRTTLKEYFAAQQNVRLTALRRWLLFLIFRDVFLLAILLYAIGVK